jgi:hypothetical protein
VLDLARNRLVITDEIYRVHRIDASPGPTDTVPVIAELIVGGTNFHEGGRDGMRIKSIIVWDCWRRSRSLPTLKPKAARQPMP